MVLSTKLGARIQIRCFEYLSLTASTISESVFEVARNFSLFEPRALIGEHGHSSIRMVGEHGLEFLGKCDIELPQRLVQADKGLGKARAVGAFEALSS